MESTSADSSLGPSAYSINSPGEDAQEKKEEDLDGGPQDSLWSAPEPTQEEPLVVVEENEGWRATYLTAEFFNVIVMSVAFFLLFAAYNTIQNYVTSLLPGFPTTWDASAALAGNLGRVSLGVLYVTVALMVFLAPAIVYTCREKWTMLIGALCYVVYMASLIKIIEWAVLGASVIIGFGAAILWVAQGSFLTLCSPKGKRGTHTGIFW